MQTQLIQHLPCLSSTSVVGEVLKPRPFLFLSVAFSCLASLTKFSYRHLHQINHSSSIKPCSIISILPPAFRLRPTYIARPVYRLHHFPYSFEYAAQHLLTERLYSPWCHSTHVSQSLCIWLRPDCASRLAAHAGVSSKTWPAGDMPNIQHFIFDTHCCHCSLLISVQFWELQGLQPRQQATNLPAV